MRILLTAASNRLKAATHGISCLQTFDREPVSTEVNPDSDTKLDCKVLNKKGTCSWQKDNK
ncbi:hypothetical protein M8J75_016504, partial [Diaphorina citri]